MHYRNIATERATNMGYIDKFESVEQIKECARYYIEILGLQDWKILFVLGTCPQDDCDGWSETIPEQKAAKITLDNTDADSWFKHPMELTLIHELMHCKIVSFDDGSLSGKIIDLQSHTLVDDMAKAIFFARYGITNKDLYF